jgi:signal peptidase
MLGNLWFVVVFVLAREVCRWHIVDTLKVRSETTALLVGWLVLSLTTLTPRSYEAFTGAESAFRFAGSFLLPMLALQFLATYLLLRGSLPASIAYVGTLMVFEWFSPILPDMPWIGAAIVGILVPVAGLFVLQPSAEAVAEEDAEQHQHIGPSPALLAALGLLVAVFWLNTGILGVKPMVVDGISMQPTYHTGDLVVARKTDPAKLKVGDIILFDNGARDVVHRIIDIQRDGQDYTITTLGDNNPAPDSPIHQDQIVGRVAVQVGKVGWPIVETKTLIGKVFN